MRIQEILEALPVNPAKLLPKVKPQQLELPFASAAKTARQHLDFDALYGKAFKITDNAGDPNNPGFSIITPLNTDSWNTWKERPEFKEIVKQRLNDPTFLGDHKYQQIIDAMSGSKFDPAVHAVKSNAVEYWGYLPGENAQARRIWSKQFNSEAEAQAWMNQRNATPMGSKPILAVTKNK